jgi:hypothetical protein
LIKADLHVAKKDYLQLLAPLSTSSLGEVAECYQLGNADMTLASTSGKLNLFFQVNKWPAELIYHAGPHCPTDQHSYLRSSAYKSAG